MKFFKMPQLAYKLQRIEYRGHIVDQGVLERMKQGLLLECQNKTSNDRSGAASNEYEIDTLIRFLVRRDIREEQEAVVRKSAFERAMLQQKELLQRLKLDNVNRKTDALNEGSHTAVAVVKVKNPISGLSTAHAFG